ncbi:MAG TPA: hypothetical protein GX696_02085 [Pseudomonadaceae bacterium]|nr:hypothetical protein [Pseudomonadaceae bacterium]
MSRDDDLIDNIPRLVPERDELVARSKRRRSGSRPASSGVRVEEVVVSRTSGPVVVLLSVLFVGMCVSGAGGYYFHTKAQTTTAELERANGRLIQLENHLNLVDQAAEQNSMDLVERVNFNFSEIDKLWAARNALRAESSELKTGLSAVQGSAKSLQETVDAHSKTLDENIVSIQARMDDINQNFAGMDNLGGQLTLLNADLNRVKTSMTAMQDSVNKQLESYGQDIESINVYRLQVNQSIQALQDSVNRLQARVGQAPATASP